MTGNARAPPTPSPSRNSGCYSLWKVKGAKSTQWPMEGPIWSLGVDHINSKLKGSARKLLGFCLQRCTQNVADRFEERKGDWKRKGKLSLSRALRGEAEAAWRIELGCLREGYLLKKKKEIELILDCLKNVWKKALEETSVFFARVVKEWMNEKKYGVFIKDSKAECFSCIKDQNKNDK